MPKQSDRFFIGPGLRTKLRETITRVDSIPMVESGPAAPVRIQDVPRGSGGCRLRIGKTTATWTKNTLMTIPLYENGTPPNETASGESLADVVNHWGDVPANKWVGIMHCGTRRFLLVAEC
jgi:hypothetical protein